MTQSVQHLPMRILHVAETLPGGISTYLNELLPMQGRQLGRENVTLLCPAEHLEHLSVQAKNGVTVRAYHRSGRNIGSLMRLRNRYQQLLDKCCPAIVHAHSSFAGAIVRTSFGGTRYNAPVIYCAHGWSFDMERPIWQRMLFAAIERRLASRAASIVVISDHEGASAAKWGIAPGQARRIYYGIRDIPRTTGYVRQSVDGPLRLLFVGRLDYQKGLDWLLERIAHLPAGRVHLTVAGCAINDRTPRLPILPNVDYSGWVSNEKLIGHYDRADAVIIPSRWEGFGLVAVEAMRRGVAVLASDRGALPEVLGTDGCGFVFQLERPDILEKFLLGVGRQQLQQMGKRGRERFERLFTCDRMVAETDALYREVLRLEQAAGKTSWVDSSNGC